MIGYVLKNTLTENGTVSRGICVADEEGFLTEVTERTAIRREGDHAVYAEDDCEVAIPLDSIASMNCWGFTPDIFDHVKEGFAAFLRDGGAKEMKKEYYLPFAVCDLMKKGTCSVRVYPSNDSWYGVTYLSDKQAVHDGIQALQNSGVYPLVLSK